MVCYPTSSFCHKIEELPPLSCQDPSKQSKRKDYISLLYDHLKSNFEQIESWTRITICEPVKNTILEKKKMLFAVMNKLHWNIAQSR